MMKRMLLLVVLTIATGVMADSATNPASLGPAPLDADDIRRVFLRESSMVLTPGLYEIETGVSYARNERTVPVSSYSEVGRQFTFPFTLRAGLFPRVEAFLAMPLAYSSRKVTDGTITQDDDVAGFGDTTGGVSVQLKQRSESWPDIVGSVSMTAPTGEDPYDSDLRVGVGSGFWKASAALQFISISDPLVLFGGFGFGHSFEETYSGVDIQPGDAINYNFGFAFAVNPDLSLNTQFLGNFIDRLENNGVEEAGSANEPMILRLGLTRRWKPDVFLDPYVELGLNDDATDTTIGFAMINRFGGR